MSLPEIAATKRIGLGYLSTIFTDSSSLPIIFRKWIFGDGTVIEGQGLSTVAHTYYYPGEYDVVLVARTDSEQYVVKKEKFIVVNKYKSLPSFIIAQSFNSDSGEYWRFYFDQNLYLVFEDNYFIVRSKERISDIGKWKFVSFNRIKSEMYVGDYSYFIKEIDTVRMPNNDPMPVVEIKTEIAPNSAVTLDELKIWNREIDLKEYYKSTRGKAGYLDSLI